MRAMQRGNQEGLNSGPLHVSASYSMKPGDFQIVASGASAAVNVTLPAMAEAIPGMVYSIYCEDATNDVSVLVKETATEIATYGDLDTATDEIVVICTGVTWVVVGSNIT